MRIVLGTMLFLLCNYCQPRRSFRFRCGAASRASRAAWLRRKHWTRSTRRGTQRRWRRARRRPWRRTGRRRRRRRRPATASTRARDTRPTARRARSTRSSSPSKGCASGTWCPRLSRARPPWTSASRSKSAGIAM